MAVASASASAVSNQRDNGAATMIEPNQSPRLASMTSCRNNPCDKTDPFRVVTYCPGGSDTLFREPSICVSLLPNQNRLVLVNTAFICVLESLFDVIDEIDFIPLLFETFIFQERSEKISEPFHQREEAIHWFCSFKFAMNPGVHGDDDWYKA
jgi:hypothetical protein